MKRIMAMMLVFAVASFLFVAYAHKEDKGRGHGKAGSVLWGGHHSIAAGAMAPHGDKEHMKAMAEFQRTMSDNFAGLRGINDQSDQ